MGYNFIKCNRDQIYLMPPSVREWLPQGDLALFIIDAVGQMDLKPFYRKYRSDGRGQVAFEPSMMTALLLYAYSVGARSSRQIERLCERDISFKVIAADRAPGHCTIARFRQENGKEIERLFTDVLKLCAKVGLVKVGVVALDGTKVKANAALEANRTYEHIEKELKKMLTEAEATDAEEDKLPEELRDSQSRLKRLKECKERLEQEAAAEAQRQREMIEEREAEEAEIGQKKLGRKPKEPTSELAAEAKANVTDPHCRIVKTRSGYVQGYNGQLVVTEEQVIVAAELTAQENDVNQLHPMVEKAQENVEVSPWYGLAARERFAERCNRDGKAASIFAI